MPKRATKVVLSEKEEVALVRITKRHRSEHQQVLRACIVLAAAQGNSNAQIARELQVNVDTVRLWRDRWVGLQGIEPCHVEHRGALAGCATTRGEAKDHGGTTLSDCGLSV
jgi:Homeodomain-like domain-containing protein